MFKKKAFNTHFQLRKYMIMRIKRDFPMMIICIIILILHTLPYFWGKQGAFLVISEIR